MIDRVVFLSVLLFLTLTASAGDWNPGLAGGDTSVIPTSLRINSTNNKDKKLAAVTPEGKKKTDNEVSFGEPLTAGAPKSGISGSGKGKSSTKVSDNVKSASGSKVTSNSGESINSSTSKPSTSNTTSKTSASNAAPKTSTTAKTSTSNTISSKTSSKSTVVKAKSTKNISTSRTFNPTASSNAKTTKTSKKSPKIKAIGIELYQPLTFKYAILLDVPVEKVTDEKLIQVLDHWYGTRYRFGGESRKGIDCSAFTQAFMRSYLDYKLPRVAAEQFATCKKIKKKKLRQGDLVFFSTHGPKGGITHVGVYLFNDRFVHSASSTGVRISNLKDDYYTEKYAGAGRIR